MFKKIVKLAAYLFALIIILVEPDFSLLIGVILGITLLYGKIKGKPVIAAKIEKRKIGWDVKR